MANITATSQALPSRTVGWIDYPVAATTNIIGLGYVGIDAAGNLNPIGDVSGLKYVGRAANNVNNTGIAGAVSCPVFPPLVIPFNEFKAASPDESWVGTHVFAGADDTTAVQAGGSSNKVILGTVVAIIATGTAGVILVDTVSKSALAST